MLERAESDAGDTVASDLTGDAEGSYLCVTVQGLNGLCGHNVSYKISKTTRLKKIMIAYCKRVRVYLHQVRFIFNGTRVYASDTPDSLGMNNGDTIGIFPTQEWQIKPMLIQPGHLE